MAKKPRVEIKPPKVNLSSPESPSVPMMPKWRPFLFSFAVLPTIITIIALQFAPVEICANIPLLPLRFDNRACLRNRIVIAAAATLITPTAYPTYTPFPPSTTPPATTLVKSAATYTPYPTYTPFPSMTPTVSAAPLFVPMEDLPLRPLSDIAAAPRLPSSVELPTLAPPPLPRVVLQPITVTATVVPSPTPRYWQAWHVVNMDVRLDPDRDGSSVVKNMLLDAQDNFTHSLEIKCRMSNAENDLRVNEIDSQKVMFENGVPAYSFYVNQQSEWDVQFYKYVSEKQAIKISELVKLPVDKNQVISLYWQYGDTQVIEHAAVNPGAGVDNGRSAPIAAAVATAPAVVVQTVIVVITATPNSNPTPSITPWIIRVIEPTITPSPTTIHTVLPTSQFTTTPAPPATATPVFVAPTATLLVPLSNSAVAIATRIYLPVIFKEG